MNPMTSSGEWRKKININNIVSEKYINLKLSIGNKSINEYCDPSICDLEGAVNARGRSKRITKNRTAEDAVVFHYLSSGKRVRFGQFAP